MKKTALLFITLTAILFASCNLDSNQGVFQMAYNATHKTNYTIIDVYGAYDNNSKLLLNRDGDLWYAETDGNELRQYKVKDLTQGAMTPIFINGEGTLFYAYRPDHYGAFSFGAASIEEIQQDGFDYSQHLITDSSLENITKFDSVNLDLDNCLIVWGREGETYYTKIENKASVGSFSLSSYVDLSNVSTASGTAVDTKGAMIFGTDALYVYYEDSDLENTPDQLAIMHIDGSNVEAITLSVDDDNRPMGYDNGYFITFDGDLYRFDREADNGYSRIRGFVSDLRYRTNHRLVLATDDTDRAVGFIYRNGVYVRENRPNNDAEYLDPRILSIDNNDNDIICASYIGRTEYTDSSDITYDRYLFATQNNDFIILEVGPGTLNDAGSRFEYDVDDSMLQTYTPRVHGSLSEYITSLG